MKFICVTLLIITGITQSDEYEVIGPSAPVMTVSGEDVILPCSIKPNFSAVNMRVQWIRLDLKDSIVHLYKDHKDINTDQLQSYRGRTQVFKEELEKGNTSLKLSRVQISDEGLYKCFIQSESWSDDITVDLRVEAEQNNIDGDEIFHSLKSSVITVAIVLSLIAAMLIVGVVYKKRGLQMEHQRINEERETLLLREERTESVTSLIKKTFSECDSGC
ncbi:myelin-oligodendrocyte glycoprotein-like [Triplophysa dalaica]|uniref:myelin-oligodendrocyte glycoprotein-like n=1 Tax=Triplophysa dalaica TaxID=1582913 RepID=UPI0024E0301C|nr:myelin-oligodendrocyte glycoprotein-like [Triplophysa dalaica]